MLNDQLKKNIDNLISSLKNIEVKDIKAVVGLDGFVDEILHVVNTRKNANEYTRINTLLEYGQRISKAAGLSTNIELVPMQVKLGGNGPIFSLALSTYGLDVTYIGALGTPNIHPVFNIMEEKGKVYSIANPGRTDAIEFLDGKLMAGKLESLKEVNWENIKASIGLENLTAMIQDSKLLGLENWTMLPHMSQVWEGIIEEVLPNIEMKDSKGIMFFDLADPEKRLKEDIVHALSLIQKFSEKFNVILGLNLKEAVEIAEILGIDDQNFESLGDYDLKKLIEGIAHEIKIYCIVVHPTKEAVAFCNGEFFHTYGPYEPNPKLTTGAGDNFNAGFCFGQVLGLSIQSSLVLGTATSGFYVRNAKSPTYNDVLEFLKTWNEV